MAGHQPLLLLLSSLNRVDGTANRALQAVPVGSAPSARNAALPKKLIAELLLHLEIRHKLNK
jgi:hypothetical protein